MNVKRLKRWIKMLKFLYGMLAGYLIAMVEFSIWLVKKGYKSTLEVPDND